MARRNVGVCTSSRVKSVRVSEDIVGAVEVRVYRYGEESRGIRSFALSGEGMNFSDPNPDVV